MASSEDDRQRASLTVAQAAGHLRRAARLAWQAAPGCTTGQGLVALAAGAAPLGAAWLLKLILDALTGSAHTARSVLALALALAAVGAVAAVMPHLGRYLEADLGRAISLASQTELFAAIGRTIGLARFEDPEFQNRILLAQQSGQAGPGAVVVGAWAVAQALVTLAGFLVTLLLLNPVLALLALAVTLPALHAELHLGRRRARALWEIGQGERRRLFYAGLLTQPEAAQEVRLYGLGQFFENRMRAELSALDDRQRQLDRRDLRAQILLGVASALLAGGALLWTVIAASRGRLSIGDVSVLLAALAGLQSAAGSLVNQLGSIHEAMLLFDHYHQVLTMPPDLPRAGSPRTLPPLERGIQLRGVSFRYADDQPWVLRGLDLTIPAGATVTLVGENGAGKSTIIKLLCRLYDPVEGQILWDGVDLRELAVEDLRQRIGAVFQDFMHYELSAFENIAVGDLAAMSDSARVSRAADFADLHHVIASLPRGYATMLTRLFTDPLDRADPSTGVLLSGGQWQRLAVARALLRDDRDLLILDEPTGGLDPEAEHRLHRRLRAHRRGRTTVLVSHRLGNIRHSDQIVVLAQGRVAELGKHAVLMQARGLYARLFRLQAANYQGGEDESSDGGDKKDGGPGERSRPRQPGLR